MAGNLSQPQSIEATEFISIGKMCCKDWSDDIPNIKHNALCYFSNILCGIGVLTTEPLTSHLLF